MSKNFEILLVWKFDRFARNKYDSAHYKQVLKNNGVRVVQPGGYSAGAFRPREGMDGRQ